MEFVDFKKQEKIKQAALLYLAQNSTEKPTRFDIIEVYAPEGLETKKPKITHLEDAFQ
jgi:putative endonuclease